MIKPPNDSMGFNNPKSYVVYYFFSKKEPAMKEGINYGQRREIMKYLLYSIPNL